jgi:hypothetical protein
MEQHNDKVLHSGERNATFKVTVFCDEEKINGHFMFLLNEVIKEYCKYNEYLNESGPLISTFLLSHIEYTYCTFTMGVLQ